MDFFGAQDQAKGRTRLLFGLWVLMVAALSGLFALSVHFLLGTYLNQDARIVEYGRADFFVRTLNWSDLQLYFMVIFGSIVTGTLIYYFLTKGRGGRGIAASAGGEEMELHSKDPNKKKLQNIVEEMAIASGMPMPSIFLLSSAQINAFAAGFSPEDAAIGVTEGAIESLNREELQGVIAHEFSHILNGDMKINAQMIGALFSLEFMMRCGELVLRGRSSRSKNGQAVLAVGLLLIVLGFIGYIGSLIIKAAVNRQREFLADASAVQFTRNPHGIGGALYKIGKESGQKIKFESGDRPQAAHDVSHMMFSSPGRSWFSSLWRTHPPIESRLKAIYPQSEISEIESQLVTRQESSVASPSDTMGFAESPVSSKFSQKSIQDVVDPVKLQAAHVLVEQSQSNRLYNESKQMYGAAGIVLCTFLSTMDVHKKIQLDKIEDTLGENISHFIFASIEPEYKNTVSKVQLIHFRQSCQTLAEMPQSQRKQILDLVKDMINIDQKVELYEYAYFKILADHLIPHRRRERGRKSNKSYFEAVIVYFMKQLVTAEKRNEVYRLIMEAYPGVNLDEKSLNIDKASIEKLLFVIDHFSSKYKRALVEIVSRVTGTDYVENLNEKEALTEILYSALRIPSTLKTESAVS